MSIKRFIAAMLLTGCVFSAFAADDADSQPDYSVSIPEYNQATIVKSIKSVRAPFISGDYAVFTAEDNSRYVGIAFDFENYRTIHTFNKIVSYDEEGEPQSSMLIFLQTLPKNCTRITYRLIIDGLWTSDAANQNKYFDSKVGTWFSYIDVNRPYEIETAVSSGHKVHFVYEGKAGQKIRLAGDFTNWDSFIYYLAETEPGRYEMDLTLPTGTWYYCFYSGMDRLTDPNNTDRVYTTDGRIASVITVK